jgi:predicted Rossmann fold nucleotide-binding protein DprA/Smf involved in DNA uptake
LVITPEHIAATALATLPAIGPQRLRMLLSGLGAVDAWRTVRGELPAGDRIAALLAQENFAHIWRQAATDDVLRRVEAALRDHHINVVLATDPSYPSVLRGDHAAPAVLFARGNLTTFAERRAGVIGTPFCSRVGSRFVAQRCGGGVRLGTRHRRCGPPWGDRCI